MTDEEYKKEYPDAYEDGRQDCIENQSNMKYENPYPWSDPQHSAWALGWGDEFAKIIRALQNGDINIIKGDE
jgi:hypothetical protein